MEAVLVVVLFVWAVLAPVVAVVVGRAIRLGDARSAGTGAPLTTADLPRGFTLDELADAPH